MVSETFLGLLITLLAMVAFFVMPQAIIFIFDVPKQLKRIADALEKEKKDGK